MTFINCLTGKWTIEDQNHSDSAVRGGNIPAPRVDKTVPDISVFLKEQSIRGARMYVYVKDRQCEIILIP